MSTRGTAAYAVLDVVEPGPLALLQDGGRPGLGAVGVSPSGAADRGAFTLGARLLGQGPREAAIECLGGLVLKARAGVTVALTGAPCPATSGGRLVGHASPFHLAAGTELRLGRPTQGLRTYVSVRGGIVVDEVLGSRSHDTLGRLGPPPLERGQALPVGHPVGDPLVDEAPVAPPATGLVTLDALPGPRLDWLEDPTALMRQDWTVASASDRVGLRLEGRPLKRIARRRGSELPSEGVMRGGVQVPADGLPLVFGADHPVTGGYPVVAALTERSADLAAQLLPGQQVRLRLLGSPGAT